MQSLRVVLRRLKSATHLNGQTGRVVSGCSTNLCGEVRFSVMGHGFCVSVRIHNLECSSTCEEDAIVGLMLRDGIPIIIIATKPSDAIMSDMGKIVISSCSSIH